MPRWMITTKDDAVDTTPARQVAIEAANLEDAAEKAAAMMQPWEKVSTVEALPDPHGPQPHEAVGPK
ncbi:hypothetical protein ASD31_00495 [Rhizobium sp. Root482]|nr:hypothetical protein ASD31_00495 [Rhizobium sp. Root482]